MAQENNAQTSKTGQKNAKSNYDHYPIDAMDVMKTMRFNSTIISVDQHYNLQVRDNWRNTWEWQETYYPLVKHQQTYHIDRIHNGYRSQHQSRLLLLLTNLPYCKVTMMSVGEYGNRWVVVHYKGDNYILIKDGKASIYAKTMDDMFDLIRLLRQANHLGTDFKVIKQNDDATTVRFKKRKKKY